jgi:hypothetical protein
VLTAEKVKPTCNQGVEWLVSLNPIFLISFYFIVLFGS